LNTPDAATPVTRRLEYIDGLRALAALWVAVHHAIETSEPTWAMSLPVVRPILGTLFFGQFPVMVFLMLSGFCLYYPYVRKAPKPTFTTGFGVYISRRFMRIAPPYYWAGAFCAIFWFFPSLSGGRWAITQPIDRWTILSHLLFVHNLLPNHANKIDYPMWSIGLEWQLYLLFPALVWAFRRVGALPTLVATLVVAAVIRGTYRHLPGLIGPILHLGPFSCLEIFALGMLAAYMTAQHRPLPAPRIVLGMGFVAGLAAIRLGSGSGLVHDLATAGAFFCLLLLATEPNGLAERVLKTPWLVRVGFFSYSIYLVHAPLLHLSWLALRPLHLSPDILFAVLALVCLPLIVGVAYGFHCLFERPFMRVKPALVVEPVVKRALP
jgi:peptidoglycan/LPS O-acetylase OafA/YrhL